VITRRGFELIVDRSSSMSSAASGEENDRSSLPASGRIRSGRRPRGTERDLLASDLAGRYRAGHSLARIAADTGWSAGLVRRLLLDIGVALRPRGGNNNPDGARTAHR
jgi:hypothetical protein